MTNNELTQVVDEQLANCKTVLTAKSKMYAPTEDKLLAFKKAAAMMQTSPEQALWGMLVKHLVSISDMIASGQTYPMDVWDEKIGDSINYLLLLKGLATERINSETIKKEA